jgi:curved DNA-binding protein
MTNEGERRKINIPVRTVVRIEFKDTAGTQWATADVTDRSEHAIGVSLMKPMKPGSVIVLRGKLGADKTEVQLRATVSWCREQSDGTFQAGLEFLDAKPDFSTGGGQPLPTDPDELDCYEVMQLSPNADAETIERVYRMLAQRYHPDNVDTGNSELFIQLCEAYRVLGSPEERASYDARYGQAKRLHWKIFDQAEAATGREAEKRKRQGILGLLYANHLKDPAGAGMTIHALEELLGCPREHLEVTLWYLREKGFIQRADNGRYLITVNGFDETEQTCSLPRTTTLQLPAAKPGG